MINLFSVNSVGSECHPYKLEVLGSNPRSRTTQRDSSAMRELYNMHASRFDGSSFSDKNGTHSDCSYFHIEDDESKLMHTMDVCSYEKKSSCR